MKKPYNIVVKHFDIEIVTCIICMNIHCFSEKNLYSYSYQMPSSDLYSTQYNKQHHTLQVFKQFGAPYMYNQDDKLLSWPGFERDTSRRESTA